MLRPMRILSRLLQKKGRYDGPVCFVDRDHLAVDGGQLYGGWHYATKMWKGNETPDSHRRLHLNTDDPEHPFYEYAEGHHQSWVQKHGIGNLVTLGGQE